MYIQAIFHFGIRFFSAITGLMLILLVSRWLGAVERGICGQFLMAVTFIGIVADFAGGAAIPYLLKEFGVFKLLKIYLGWSVFPTMLIPLLGYYIGWMEGATAFWLFIVGAFHCMYLIQQHLLLGLGKMFWFSFFSFLPAFTSFTSFACTGWFYQTSTTWYFKSIGLGWVVAVIGGTVLLLSSKNHFPEKKSNSPMVKIFSFGAVNQMSHLVTLLNTRWMYFWLPAAQLGVLANAVAVVEALLLLPGSLGQVYYSKYVNTPPDKIIKLQFLNLLFFTGFGLLVGASTLYFFPSTWWLYIFGDGFVNIGQLIRPLLLPVACYGWYLLLSYWFSAKGKFSMNLTFLSWGFLAHLVVSGFFYAFGWVNEMAAAYAYGGGLVVTGFFSMISFWKRGAK